MPDHFLAEFRPLCHIDAGSAHRHRVNLLHCVLFQGGQQKRCKVVPTLRRNVLEAILIQSFKIIQQQLMQLYIPSQRFPPPNNVFDLRALHDIASPTPVSVA